MLALMIRMFNLLTALRTFLQETLLRGHSFQLCSRRRLAWLTGEISSVSASLILQQLDFHVHQASEGGRCCAATLQRCPGYVWEESGSLENSHGQREQSERTDWRT